MAATSAQGGVVGYGGSSFRGHVVFESAWFHSAFIGYTRPTCSSHHSNQEQPHPPVQPRAARPGGGGGGSGGNDGGAGQSRGAGSWPPLPMLAGGGGDTAPRPETSESRYRSLQGPFHPYTMRGRCDKGLWLASSTL